MRRTSGPGNGGWPTFAFFATVQPRLPDRWLRLRNYGHFIHQPPPIMQWQIASSGSNAAGVFLFLKRDDEKNDKDRMDHDCRPQ
jgi:hypothetical protein